VYHNVTRKEDTDDEKKEKVIHTRVPERLENELRERAESLGISVSNLVRNVLGHAFGLVGDIMADGASVARAARGGKAAGAGAAAPDPADVLAWQPIVLNKNAVCTRCNAVLLRGADAAIGVLDGAGARPVICPSCVKELRDAKP
jgi:hypothetical protein